MTYYAADRGRGAARGAYLRTPRHPVRFSFTFCPPLPVWVLISPLDLQPWPMGFKNYLGSWAWSLRLNVMPENSRSERKKRHSQEVTYLGQHKSDGKSREWVNMRNQKQSKEWEATKREATKQTINTTRAKEKSVGHHGLLALQTKHPKLGWTKL